MDQEHVLAEISKVAKKHIAISELTNVRLFFRMGPKMREQLAYAHHSLITPKMGA